MPEKHNKVELANNMEGFSNLHKGTEPQNSSRITNYDYFINARSKRRMPSALREITKKYSQFPPHGISLAVGAPNTETFPFEEFSVKLKDGSSFKLEGKSMESALTYLPSSGYPPLLKLLQDLQDKTHGPQDWTRQNVLITCGSSEPTSAVIDMVLNEGDPVIIPVPLYVGPPDAMRIYKLDFIALDQDKDGVQPQQLRQKLEERIQQKKPMPKLMYVNPVACNPTGRNLSLERKQEIYRLACEYNFLILEDDPYFSLHFLEENIPSLLSMDVEGRVIRLDSFSKILSSGLRVGFVSGPTQLVRQLELHIQISSQHTAALSQVLVTKLLEHWGYEKYLEHIQRVKKFYQNRRDLMLASCDRYLKGLAEWETSMGGMFLWVRVPVLRDTWELANKHCLERFLLIAPGHPFTGELTPTHYNYIRLSYSISTAPQIEQGIKLLSEIIREVKESKAEQEVNF